LDSDLLSETTKLLSISFWLPSLLSASNMSLFSTKPLLVPVLLTHFLNDFILSASSGVT
jgi:hypothetical protein